MTQFWSDNALITGGEAFQARKAMSLIEALLGFPSTGDTKDIARERQCDGFTHQRIHINCVVSDGQFIAHRILQLRAHFFDGASHVLGISPGGKTQHLIQHPINQ